MRLVRKKLLSFVFALILAVSYSSTAYAAEAVVFTQKAVNYTLGETVTFSVGQTDNITISGSKYYGKVYKVQMPGQGTLRFTIDEPYNRRWGFSIYSTKDANVKLADVWSYSIPYDNNTGSYRKSVDTALDAGEYYIIVRLGNPDGSNYGIFTVSDPNELTMNYIPPKVKISKTSNTESGVKISWGKVSGVAKYQVYRKYGSGSWKKLGQTTSTSFVDKTAKNGKTYSYRVRGVASDGSVGGFGASKKQTYAARPTLSSVKNTSGKKMKVKWKKMSGGTGFQVQYSTSSTFAKNSKKATVKGASSVSKVISSLKLKKTYYVRIRSYKTVSGEKVYSAWSVKKSVKISK